MESKLTSSTHASDITEIRKEFEELKKEISKLQDKAVASVKDLEKRSRISYLLNRLSHEDFNVLRAFAETPGWKTYEKDPNLTPNDLFFMRKLFGRVEGLGLLQERTVRNIMEFKLDDDLREALLR